MKSQSKVRCINIDWFELYCIEPIEPRDAEYFRYLGLHVQEREYGTRVYKEMFTIYGTDGYPLIEIRRNPLSDVMPIGSCHIRLTNRTCYVNDCVRSLMQFVENHGFTYQRISRVDICLDFEYFDRGDVPADFLDRYIKGRYTKINQANIRCHGKDTWKKREWNSISWGSAESTIGTKMYNKSLELKDVKDKPYIRRCWFDFGLIDNPITMTKKNEKNEEYTPVIWRVEFSIKSDAKNWCAIELNGEKKNYYSIPNKPELYYRKDTILGIFASLADHYFHFKLYNYGLDKYHSRDKVLFDFGKRSIIYKIEKTAQPDAKDRKTDILKRLLEEYRQVHFEEDIRNACDVLLDKLTESQIGECSSSKFSKEEIRALQIAIKQRIEEKESNKHTDIDEIINILKKETIY